MEDPEVLLEADPNADEEIDQTLIDALGRTLPDAGPDLPVLACVIHEYSRQNNERGE